MYSRSLASSLRQALGADRHIIGQHLHHHPHPRPRYRHHPHRHAGALPSSTPPVSQGTGLLEHYNSLVSQGVLQHDEHQKDVMGAFDQLLGQLVDYEREMQFYHEKLYDWRMKRNQLRQQLLKEEAEKEAQHQLKIRMEESKKGSVQKWLSRLKERLEKAMSDEAEGRRDEPLYMYKERAVQMFMATRRNKKAEPGAGRMVARINREKKLDQQVGPPPALPLGPKGIYVYGSVGCGKTMLMDMFYNAADGIVKHRRRLHFHGAMLEVHDWMHKAWKKKQEQRVDTVLSASMLEDSESLESPSVQVDKFVKCWVDSEERDVEENILDLVAENLLGNIESRGGARLLCFDEMQINDVFTAVALSGIFGRLIKKGAIIVATSNRAPSDLNKDGMQKELFSKFIEELQHHCQLILMGTEKDYRRFLAMGVNVKGGWPNYIWPLDQQAEEHLEQKWQDCVLQSAGKVVPAAVPVMFGRTLEVPASCNGVARFSFEQLCDRPVGAADYISLARNFHTVFVTGIPIMSMRNRDKARRFITLVDELYNHRRQLICTAATSIDDLFLGSEEGSLVDLESIQFETEAENSRLRRDVSVSGSVAPVGSSMEDRMRIQSLFSGREELFAFQRAISRLIEMQTPVYLQGMDFQIHDDKRESCE